MSCPDFKAMIDRRPQPGTADAAALDAHLASCASCESYKSDADRTHALLCQLRRVLATVDPIDNAFDLLSARLKSSRRQLVWSLALTAACAITGTVMLVRHGWLPGVGWLLLAGAVAMLLAAWQLPREQAAMTRLARREGDFYERWRTDLRKRIRSTTGGAIFVSVWSIGFVPFALFRPWGVVEQAVILGTAFILGVGALNTFFVELRDLKSELDLVNEASRG
jgi:hypothetical protein